MGLLDRFREPREQINYNYQPPEVNVHPMMYQADNSTGQILNLTIQNDDLIKKLKAKFKGKVVTIRINQRTGSPEENEEDYGDPIMNDKGVKDIIGFVESLCHRNTIMSNINNYNFLMDLSEEAHISITKQLIKKHKDYAFDLRNTDFVVEECMNVILFSMSRGEGRGEAKLSLPGRKEIHTYHDDAYSQSLIAQQKRGGFVKF